MCTTITYRPRVSFRIKSKLRGGGGGFLHLPQNVWPCPPFVDHTLHHSRAHHRLYVYNIWVGGGSPLPPRRPYKGQQIAQVYRGGKITQQARNLLGTRPFLSSYLVTAASSRRKIASQEDSQRNIAMCGCGQSISVLQIYMLLQHRQYVACMHA